MIGVFLVVIQVRVGQYRAWKRDWDSRPFPVLISMY